jgi:predicted alpha/beta superfamily hydrolase
MTAPLLQETPPQGPEHTLTGEFRIYKLFRSKFLTAERNVIVYIPPGYDAEPLRRYPVLYMHDGQNLFDVATSVGSEWGVDETAQRLVQAEAIEPVLIVGVYNTGERRIDEYTPTRHRGKGHGGKAGLYGRMLVEELKPLIDGQYRTLRDAANTGLAGSSLGGLASLYLGLHYPTTFGKLGIISPSVWWDNRMILREVRALGDRPPLRIWLSTGTGEARGVLPNARRLRDALIRKGWVIGRDLAYHEAEGAGHNEHAWAEIVEPFLRFLFPAKPPSAVDWGGLERL